MMRGDPQGLVCEPIKNDMNDYEEYEQQCELIRKENRLLDETSGILLET